MQTPTPTASVPQGPMNVAEAANALEAMLPDEGQQQTQEAQLSGDEPEAALVDNELSDADAENLEATDEQLEEEGDQLEEEQPQTFTVKVDGKEETVTLEELQKGYSRTQDYTRKTQQIAEVRKQVEQETQAVRAERAQYAQLLGALSEQVQQALIPQVDMDRLKHEDPIEWVKLKEVIRDNQEKAIAIQAEQQRLQYVAQQEHIQNLQANLAEEQKALVSAIPEWKDPTKAAAEKKMLLEFGQKMGFKPQELSQIYDHRVVHALRKAALYDQMMSKRTNIKPVVNNGPRTAKPGAAGRISQTTEAVRAKQRLAQTGRVEDAASAIEHLLR